MARQADAHQLDVIAQEVHFGLERYRRPAAVVEYVPQQAAQVVHRLLGPVGIELDERIDVVERVEQEMGIELALEVLQFRFGAAPLQVLADVFGPVPLSRHPDGDAYSDYQQVEHGIAQEEEHRILPRTLHRRMVGPRRYPEAEEKVYEQHDPGHEQRIGEQESPHMPREKVTVDQQEIVHVKYRHEGEGNHQKPHVFLHVHNGLAAARYEKRKAENHAPGRQVEPEARMSGLQGCHPVANIGTIRVFHASVSVWRRLFRIRPVFRKIGSAPYPQSGYS